MNHSAQLNCECMVGILTVIKEPRRSENILTNMVAEGFLNILTLSFVHGLRDVGKMRPMRRKTLNNQSINPAIICTYFTAGFHILLNLSILWLDYITFHKPFEMFVEMLTLPYNPTSIYPPHMWPWSIDNQILISCWFVDPE